MATVSRRLALFRALMMVNAAITGAVLFIVWRHPYLGLVNFMGPLLVSCGAMSEPSTMRRGWGFVRNCSLSALIMWGFELTANHNLLALIYVATVAYLLHKYLKNTISACSIMLAGLMNVGYVSYINSADAAISLFVASLIIALLYIVFEKLFCWPSDMVIIPTVPPLDNGAVWRRTVMFTLAYYLVEITGWEESFWITMSVGLACSGGNVGTELRQLAWQRGLLTPFGVLLAVAVMQGAVYFDYRFLYLVPLIGFSEFYVLNRTGNYPIYYFMFILMLTMNDTLLAGTGHFGNPVNYFFQAASCIFIGTAVILCVEPSTAFSLRLPLKQ